MTTTLLLTATLLALTGCTTLAPGAEAVKVTRDPKDVLGCHFVGQVSGLTGNQALPGANKKMANAAAAMGADVVFVTSTITSYDGVAYKCKGVDPRQPVPVINAPALSAVRP